MLNTLSIYVVINNINYMKRMASELFTLLRGMLLISEIIFFHLTLNEIARYSGTLITDFPIQNYKKIIIGLKFTIATVHTHTHTHTHINTKKLT